MYRSTCFWLWRSTCTNHPRWSQGEPATTYIDFCLFADFVIMNTLFQKPDNKKCTFKETATEGFTTPWSPDRFAQIDFILAPRAFKNSILDISARTITFNSDHCIVTANLRVKWKAQSPPTTVVRYHQPTEKPKAKSNIITIPSAIVFQCQCRIPAHLLGHSLCASHEASCRTSSTA